MKKVTMFVWNHFTNDARVMREGMALSQNNYDINLIAIENKKDALAPRYEVINDRFRVHRVPMYPWLLELYQNNKKAFIFSVAGATTVVAPVLFYKSWVLLSSYFIILAAAYTSVKNNAVRRNMIKVIRSFKMIIQGYKHAADIYHSHDLNTLTQGVICSKLRVNRKKLIYDSHEVQTDRTGYNPRFASIWEGCLLKFVDETIVENHTRAKHHDAIYGNYPETLYNYSAYCDIDDTADLDLRDQLSLPSDEKILLYQGGLQSGRGLELLIKMMHQVKEGTLVFIGDGRLKDALMEQAAEEDLESRIKFFGKADLSDLPSYTKEAYLGFQVLQNTSFNHYSASSNKLFEYIMAHVPVVSCDFPEIKKVVQGEELGIAIDASNVDALAGAVNTLLDDEGLRNQYSDNCKQAKLKYNWNNEQKKLLRIYENL
ncbi:glycosyltransferase family 4 protein [Salinicoccus cyprini]|uniref:Glycosyltransferase family 4 protein n=1 Tax=Salinicoccus cyprini TaxID=2493691 RepID=A0A558AX90_9STAP|nr:glycosyltransferase [Salinicoccus cyprini]TVT28869.1 glycosyltransferase family 4 protein [Salinicoccus cyprini]